ncbi:MAG: Txe/YoeB family addiction module toxin [Prevotellaceae bacterium]|jgi:toxin YoeB|nr:Txe/YoeB family addiction module toxin [Prevotellaceae bacterium]
MSYKIRFTEQAVEETKRLKKSETAAYKKLRKLLAELIEHPYTGTGKPEPMKYDYAGCYSRRITKKHRLVYNISEQEITVLILSTANHYDDR